MIKTYINKVSVVCKTEKFSITYCWWGEFQSGSAAFWFERHQGGVYTLNFDDINRHLFVKTNTPLFERSCYVCSGITGDNRTQIQLPNYRIYLSREQAQDFHEVLLAFQSIVKNKLAILQSS